MKTTPDLNIEAIAKTIKRCHEQQSGLIKYHNMGKAFPDDMLNRGQMYGRKLVASVAKKLKKKGVSLSTATLYGVLRFRDLPIGIVKKLDRARCPWRAMLMLLRSEGEERDELLADIQSEGAEAFVDDYRERVIQQRKAKTRFFVIDKRDGSIVSKKLTGIKKAKSDARSDKQNYQVLHCRLKAKKR